MNVSEFYTKAPIDVIKQLTVTNVQLTANDGVVTSIKVQYKDPVFLKGENSFVVKPPSLSTLSVDDFYKESLNKTLPDCKIVNVGTIVSTESNNLIGLEVTYEYVGNPAPATRLSAFDE